MGPDGAIYIADWYNPIIQHGEVDFRDPRRDHTHGRIWRVTAKGRPLVAAAQARRRLGRRSCSTRSRRPRTGRGSTPSACSRNAARQRWSPRWRPGSASSTRPTPTASIIDSKRSGRTRRSTWSSRGCWRSCSDSRDPRVRAAATRVVRHWHRRLPDPLALLAPRVRDDDPRVRLEAVRALAQIPSLAAAETAMQALDRPVDPFLDYALWSTARELQHAWLPEVQAGRFDFGGNPRHLVFALQAVGSPEVLKPLLALFQSGRVPARAG